VEISLKNEKYLTETVRHFSILIRTKGMGEIFHGQTKGYMFVVINFTIKIYHARHYMTIFLCIISHYCQKVQSHNSTYLTIKIEIGRNSIKRRKTILKKFPYLIMILFFLFAFFLHILALLKIFPLLFSVPILFVSILILLYSVNGHNRFKGF